MADNTTLNVGTGGDVIASDDIGGVKFQRVKPALGADGAAVDSIAVSNGLDSTGAGIPANGIVGQLDDAATGTVTENQFAPVRISPRRALLVEGVASGTALAVDGSAVTQPVSNAGLTELAAAINGSNQLDVNIAAQGVNVTVNAHAVTNAGTFATQVNGDALTALQLIDDPVAVLGTATYTEAATKGMVVGAVRRDADTTLVDTTNEVAPLIVDARGLLKVEAFSGEVLPVSDNAGSLTVDAPVGTPVFTRLSDGAAALIGQAAMAASLPVVIASNQSAIAVAAHDVTNAGTFATQVDGAALTALQLIDDPVKVDDAGFTVATDKVMMVGAVAVAHGANPDAADANDAVARLTNRHRIPFVIGGHPNIVTIKHTNITTAVTDAAIITVGAGVKIVVTGLLVTLDNASTVFPTVLIGFGTANTPTTTGVIAAHGGVPAGGGFSRGDGSGMIGVGADNEDLRVTTTGNATGNGLQIVVTYYTIES